MKTADYVRIEKLEATPDALFPTAAMGEWVAGAEVPNLGKGLPIGYSVEGFLLTDIGVGLSINMDRRRRNNIDMIGEFQTSQVMQVQGDLVATRNSVYRISKLEKSEDVDMGDDPAESEFHAKNE